MTVWRVSVCFAKGSLGKDSLFGKKRKKNARLNNIYSSNSLKELICFYFLLLIKCLQRPINDQLLKSKQLYARFH